MPLALKGKIVQDLKKRGEGYRQAGGRVGFIHEGVYSDYVYYFLLLPVRVAGNRLTRYIRMKLKGTVDERVYRIMKQEFYNTLCNRLGGGMAQEKLVGLRGSVSDFDYCRGSHGWTSKRSGIPR